MKYRATNKYVMLLVTAVALMQACKKITFGDQYTNNPNPNVITEPNTAYLMTNAIYRSLGRGNNGQVNGDLLTLGYKEATFFVQYTSEALYVTDGSLYSNTFGSWALYYTGPLMDLRTIIDYNRTSPDKAAVNGSNANQIATARIWRAFLFSKVTDRWGDVPYSEANQIGNITPKYDKQQDIYNDLFKELTEAVAQFDNGAVFKGDILFNGDVAKWKRFANSLHMILALRLSKVDPAKGKTEFLSAYNNAAGYITTNTQNAFFNYLNDLNFRNPWNNNQFETNKFGLSEFFINMLSNAGDPRLAKYATPATGSVYKGVPYGLDAANLSAWLGANPNYSIMGSSFTSRNSPGYLITAAQMLLTRAEAGLLGWVSGTDPQSDYQNAIRASMDQNGITDATAINTYLNRSDIAINPANLADAIQKIATQKYLVLFPDGIEAFSEWRRTGYPQLTPAPYAINQSKQIPRRWGYPTDEATLNSVNYQNAINALGGTNSIDARVWWDRP
jgi:hypothetical protein